MEWTVILAGVLGVVLAGALVLGWYRRIRPPQVAADRRTSDLERRASARLAAALQPGIGTHLEQPPTLEEVAVVTDPAGRSASVPVVRVDLGTSEAPGMAMIFEFVTPILEAIAPAFADERVHHYEVRFRFGPDGLLVSGGCRRVAVTPELVDRLEDPDYRAFDLRRDVERRDDGDERPPVLWGECVAHERATA